MWQHARLWRERETHAGGEAGGFDGRPGRPNKWLSLAPATRPAPVKSMRRRRVFSFEALEVVEGRITGAGWLCVPSSTARSPREKCSDLIVLY